MLLFGGLGQEKKFDNGAKSGTILLSIERHKGPYKYVDSDLSCSTHVFIIKKASPENRSVEDGLKLHERFCIELF